MSFWDRCALPVLEAFARSDDPNLCAGFLSLGAGRGRATIGIDFCDAEMHQALLVLGDAGYVEWADLTYETGPGAVFSGLRITGRGQQVRGQWPFFDVMTSPQTLAMTFEALADLVTEEERSALLRARDKVLTLSVATVKTAAIAGGSQITRNALGIP